MRIPLVLGACALLLACAFEYDASGTLYPPDTSCADLDACFKAQEARVQSCLEAIPENPPDYFGAMWTCFKDAQCFDPATTRAQVEAFFGRCWSGQIDTSGTLDAAWRDAFWSELSACLDGPRADQEWLIDLCYVR